MSRVSDQLKALLAGVSGSTVGDIPDQIGALIGGALDPRFAYEDYLKANRAENERLRNEATIAHSLGGALGTGASMLSTGGGSLALKAPALAKALAKTGGLIPQSAITAAQVGSVTDSPAAGVGVATSAPLLGKAAGVLARPATLLADKARQLAPFMSKGRLTPEIEQAYLKDPSWFKDPTTRDAIATKAEDLAPRAREYGAKQSAAAVEKAKDELPTIYPEDVIAAIQAKKKSLPAHIASPIEKEKLAALSQTEADYKSVIPPPVDPNSLNWRHRSPFTDLSPEISPDVIKNDIKGFGKAGDFESYGALSDGILKKSKSYSDDMDKMAPSVGASVRLAEKLGKQPSGNTVANQLVDSESKRLRDALPSSQADNLMKDIKLLESNKDFGSDIADSATKRAMYERMIGDKTQGSSGINLWSILGGGLGGAAIAGAGNYAAGDDKAAKMSMGAGAAVGAALGGLRDKKGGAISLALLDAYKKLSAAPGGISPEKMRVLEEIAKKAGVGVRSTVAGNEAGRNAPVIEEPQQSESGETLFSREDSGKDGELLFSR